MTGNTWRWIALLAFAVVVVGTSRIIGPAVPNELVMLTGPEGTTFFEDGRRYQKFLRQHGIELHLESTTGSAENLQRIIHAEKPTTTFIWGLLNRTGQKVEPPEGISSLGTLYLNPVWIFAKKGTDMEALGDLRGQRIEAGPEGSDARMLAALLLREEGLGGQVGFRTDNPVTIDELHETLAGEDFAAILAVGEPDSELIDSLLRSPELQVVSIRRADAFAIRFPFLEAVHFPEGAHDLRLGIPNRDLQLLAARTQLIVSDLFPPALADLLLRAASEIHGERTAFSLQGEFPNSQTSPLPLNRAAAHFYTEGLSPLQRYLPFRVATWIDRFAAAALAIASAALTIFNVLPALIRVPFRRRLKRSFSELRAIEISAVAGTEKDKLTDRLHAVDRSTAAIRVPLRSLEIEWLELRQYLHDMRDRLES